MKTQNIIVLIIVFVIVIAALLMLTQPGTNPNTSWTPEGYSIATESGAKVANEPAATSEVIVVAVDNMAKPSIDANFETTTVPSEAAETPPVHITGEQVAYIEFLYGGIQAKSWEGSDQKDGFVIPLVVRDTTGNSIKVDGILSADAEVTLRDKYSKEFGKIYLRWTDIPVQSSDFIQEAVFVDNLRLPFPDDFYSKGGYKAKTYSGKILVTLNVDGVDYSGKADIASVA